MAYIYPNQSDTLINKEIDLRLGEFTAQGAIKSEKEYKDTIAGILANIDTSFSRITTLNKYKVTGDDTVFSKNLSELFRDLEADIRILHSEVYNAKLVLDISLSRNKIFFSRIKEKISAMYKEIAKFRETSFNVESADYLFFESFDAENSSMVLNGMTIDSKTGEAHLTPVSITIYNNSSDINSVEVSIYPVSNIDGGTYDTTNPSNTLPQNYLKGSRNMLKSGLWKVQMITAGIPSVKLDLFGKGYNEYRGVVATVDIEFTSLKLINEIGIDPFGEFSTTIAGIQYKTSTDGSWQLVTSTNPDGTKQGASDTGSDWIYFRNLDTFSAKWLRIVFLQENFSTVQKLLNSVDTMVDQVVRDLVERRYEETSYSFKFVDQLPRAKTEEDHSSLYSEVMNAIETAPDVESLENRVSDLIIPKPKKIEKDISNWKIYNLGMWSFEPKQVLYNSKSVGTYYSHDPRGLAGFRMDKGAPTQVTLYTRQTEPGNTMIEWSLVNDDGTVEIPIMPVGSTWRSEAISYANYTPLENERSSLNLTNKSTVIKLDFPVHTAYTGEIYIYQNGKLVASSFSNEGISFLNSTELYLSSLDLSNGKIYTVKYIPAFIDTVECWILSPNTVPTIKDDDTINIDVSNGLVFANKFVADSVKTILEGINIQEGVAQIAGKYSDPIRCLCTTREYYDWFSDGRANAFVDELFMDNGIDVVKLLTENGLVESIKWSTSSTKLSYFYNKQLAGPVSDTGNGLTWDAMMSAPPLITKKIKQYV